MMRDMKKEKLREALVEALTTKVGGYEEVPRELILEQARKVGVEYFLQFPLNLRKPKS